MPGHVMTPMRSLLARLLPLTVLLALAAPGTAAAQARTWTVTSGSRIQFVSDAPLERITGTSSSVSGTVTADPENLSSVSGRVSVPISSLRTGNGLRDEHLRSDSWLDAASYPDAIFELVSVSGVDALVPGEVARVTLHGRFTIHGHTHDITANAQVRWLPASVELRADGVTGDLLRVQAYFAVDLPDYGISVNPLVRLQVSDRILVNVTIRAVSS